MIKYRYLFFVMLIYLVSCKDGEEVKPSPFTLLDNKSIGIDFINQLEYNREFNVYKYRNYYNGGGVALGDVNNDGMVDIYFTANLKLNQLYLNKGNNSFKNVTDAAGVGGTRSWSTGVTMVDINSDGFLDIYVCNSGDIKGDNKENELFINNGDGTFIEKAEEFGLNDGGFSTHASFFDFDKDGDLDVYLLNNSYQAIGSFNLRKDERPNRDEKGGDKLLRNDNGKFVDISEEAGIYGSVIGFGLGITVGDVNNDFWEDIYVSNDFFERDYLYLNNQDGTFTEVLTDQMTSISGASMGADMADIDNDGNADIFVTEMLPSDPERLKSVTTFEDWNKYQYNLKNGYHHQFTRNTLQYNNGDGTFSELGRFAGVEASDWSWGALFFDMDNDGLKDLFVANGIYQDLTDQDYLRYVSNEKVMQSIIRDDGVNYKELIDIIPSNPIPNHFYRNLGNLQFERQHNQDVDITSFSNGAAYGDLDNDGDLDLVVNNVNMPPFIYQNNSNSKDQVGTNNYLSIELLGDSKNRNGIGSYIKITNEDGIEIHTQVQPARGFQSSMDTRLVIGIGKSEKVDVEVLWPDLSMSSLKDQKVNQLLKIEKGNGARNVDLEKDQNNEIFTSIDLINHRHVENAYSDFNRERLIYTMKSNLLPKLSIGDLNGDDDEDIVVTGSKGAETIVFIKTSDEQFEQISLNDPFSKDQEHSDVHLFDADGDSDLDIYLASGGVDVSPFSPSLFDQLWINEGQGGFVASKQKLPNEKDNISTSVVISDDVDSDGDLDLFVGERVKIGKYGAACSGYILMNNGQGEFTDVTTQLAPDLIGVGMINDATFSDIDGEEGKELIVVGEFMNVHIFKWRNGRFINQNNTLLSEQSGWHNKVHVVDLNNDGLKDILIGNHGLNSRFKASKESPIKIYYNDYDQNAFPEGILTSTGKDGKDYPFALRHNLIDQLKYLKKRFPDYSTYKNADMTTIFTPEELENAQVSSVNNLETKLFMNKGQMVFEEAMLPKEAQYSPVYAITSGDYDHDGDLDIILAGNQFNVLPEAGIYDASYGVYLENDGTENFKYRLASNIGLDLKGQVRDLVTHGNELFITRNNDTVLTYKF